jgi:hypothetical protein
MKLCSEYRPCRAVPPRGPLRAARRWVGETGPSARDHWSLWPASPGPHLLLWLCAQSDFYDNRTGPGNHIRQLDALGYKVTLEPAT